MFSRGYMRDAQIEAIKTYLYLKIACDNRSLLSLFCGGKFNSANLEELEISQSFRQYLVAHPAAQALFEYSGIKDSAGQPVAKGLANHIKSNFEAIDFAGCLRRIFYEVDYPEYIFSLPMGAGKTYLMAAFIYLDLYFASNEPDNPAFSHNFLILIPSGLKSSIIDSIREIQEFDPSWIIPEPAASRLKRMLKFEVLDELKSGNKSNIVRNPNAQKINAYRPFDSLMGLVAVVNAEKIIYDGVDKADADTALFSKEELAKHTLANELRKMLGSLPFLSLLIDEVHHAADDELKLRKVVKQWQMRGNVKSILGFSGTPNLAKAERIRISDTFEISNKQLNNVVYYYPLIQAIGNFLKTPEVKYLDSSGSEDTVLRRGVEEFLDKFGKTVYPDGCCAKLAVYCGQIAHLEEEVYPIVARILMERGYNPAETILKYHQGNNAYKCDTEAELTFKSLDMPFTTKKIILLVQIGKEGWNCRSLTSVILPHKGACPTNMVLQTSCRCLRQVQKGAIEPALIWLNKTNADQLNKQLQSEQNITLKEFSSLPDNTPKEIHRHSRMDTVKLPDLEFYQLRVEYIAEVKEQPSPVRDLLRSLNLPEHDVIVETTQDLAGEVKSTDWLTDSRTERFTFYQWLLTVSKEGFGKPSMKQLMEYRDELQDIFTAICDSDGSPSQKYDHAAVRKNIRLCFYKKRSLAVKQDIVSESASLLQVENLVSPLFVADDSLFTPPQNEVDMIVSKREYSPETLAAIELLRSQGLPTPPLPQKHLNTYHYLPYHFDSSFEQKYFLRAALPLIQDRGLELYFNGDDLITEFKIKCFRKEGNNWRYIGRYVPDFLMLSRTPEGKIDKVCIIETKGKVYANNFADRKDFMETEFIHQNNDKFGYARFAFLYVEDTLTEEQQRQKTISTITEFFNA